MPIVDAAGPTNCCTARHMNARHINHFSGADKANNPVVIEM
jgi:hypothetical protein